MDESSAGAGRRGPFRTTRWSVVLAARRRDEPQAEQALATLCETYWYPLYAYARRHGLDAEQAKDETQAFFTRLLEKDTLRHVAPEKGRFRTFLLVSFKNFLSDSRARAAAKKRGGDTVTIPIDLPAAEGRYAVVDPPDPVSPDTSFDRQWALTLLARVLDRLREEHAGRPERRRRFELLQPFLAGASESMPYAAVASELGLDQVSVKVAVHRLRRRYRSLLLEEIAHTVGNRDEVEAELRHLFAAVAAPG
jgi:RNA polymerase sigma-70 factor (ECF subfamily)